MICMNKDNVYLYEIPFKFSLDYWEDYDYNHKDLNALDYWFMFYDDTEEIEVYSNEEEEPLFTIRGYDLKDIENYDWDFEKAFRNGMYDYLNSIDYFNAFGEDDSPTTEEDILEHLNYKIEGDLVKYIWNDENEEFIRENEKGWI